MNRLLFIVLCGVLLFVACNKDEGVEAKIPVWLQEKVDEVISDNNMCGACNVSITEFEGEKYYNFYCDHWSCAYCHFYNQDGIIPDWNTEKWNKYFEEKKEISVISACP